LSRRAFCLCDCVSSSCVRVVITKESGIMTRASALRHQGPSVSCPPKFAAVTLSRNFYQGSECDGSRARAHGGDVPGFLVMKVETFLLGIFLCFGPTFFGLLADFS
jgi:hypothetical protein